MPSRFVRLIAEHSENDKRRAEARNTSSLEKRIAALLKKLNPRKNPEMFKPVEGANLMTEWERSFAQLASLIVVDELSTVLLQELPEISDQVNREMLLADVIGPEAIRRIPPIDLTRYKEIAEELEGEE